MKVKTDRRILRTRAFLFDALIALLHERPFKDISIKDLTDRANIARPTFYRNYSSIQDILLEELDFRAAGFLKETEEVISNCIYLNEIMEILFMRWNDNSELFLAMYKANMDNFILDNFIFYAKEMMEIINKNYSEEIYIPRLHYFAGGVHNMLKNWLLTDRPYPISEMSEIMARGLFPLVKNPHIKLKQ